MAKSSAIPWLIVSAIMICLSGCAGTQPSPQPDQPGLYSDAECGPYPRDYEAIIQKWYIGYGKDRSDGPGALGHLASIGTPSRASKDDGEPGWKVPISEFGQSSTGYANGGRTTVMGSLDWEVLIYEDKVIDYR